MKVAPRSKTPRNKNRPLLAGPLGPLLVRGQENVNPQNSTKIIITNLANDVTDSEVCELFSEFGSVREVAVHYNCWGYSLGTAHVVYLNPNHAAEAARRYNGVPLDGRPMTITLEGNHNGGGQVAPPVPVKMRLSFGPQHQVNPFRNLTSRSVKTTKDVKRLGVPRGQGRPQGRASVMGRGKPIGRLPTAAELDLELEEYAKQKRAGKTLEVSDKENTGGKTRTPKNTPGRGKKTPIGTPKASKTPVRTAKSSLLRTPKGTPSRLQSNTPNKTPKSEAKKTPGRPKSVNPSGTPEKTASPKLVTPKSSSKKTPGRPKTVTPKSSSKKTPDRTKSETPRSASKKTPGRPKSENLAKTPKSEPKKKIGRPRKTLGATPDKVSEVPMEVPDVVEVDESESSTNVQDISLEPSEPLALLLDDSTEAPQSDEPVVLQEIVSNNQVSSLLDQLKTPGKTPNKTAAKTQNKTPAKTPAKTPSTRTPAKRRATRLSSVPPPSKRTPAKTNKLPADVEDPTAEVDQEDIENVELLPDLSKSAVKNNPRKTGRFSRI